ncbi:MAG TPA: ATP-binding protein, partial [Polyangiaceae bacterium]
TDRAGRVVIEVSDTGPGIPEEILDRVFDPFFTKKPPGVGTGLGLWICQGIVTSLGGHITAESKPGGGATFRVLLPSATTVEQASSQPPRPAPAPPREKRVRLLVVDDEIAIGRTLAIALGDVFDVATATSGREALALLLEGGERKFDVILCDLMMPDVSGMDVYERIIVHAPALARRFVFVTGGAFTDRARAFVERVQTPVIEKPFDLSSLPDLLRTQAAT